VQCAAASALLALALLGAPPARAQAQAPDSGPRFDIELQAPEPLRAFLLRHAELQRFRDLPDLDASELDRLVAQAPADLRNLLGTQGHFSPVIRVRVAREGARPQVQIDVEPGPPTRVASVDVRFAPATAGDPQAEARQSAARAQWSLPPGQPFTQAAWDDAKTRLLRGLTAQRYPMARLQDSRADIDPTQQQAHLSLQVDTGAPVRLGELQVEGAERYPPAQAADLARLAGLVPGADYDLATLQAAQQRLAESGYYSAAFVFVDTAGDPNAAPVVLQLREAQLQKLVLGVGASTNSGPRLSLEHTHHRVPGLHWRSTVKLRAERDTPLAEGELRSPRDASGWYWNVGALAQRERDADLSITSQRLRAGRTTDTPTRDRSFYLQYDRARSDSEALRAAGPLVAESSISVNFALARRQYDALPVARQGHGYSAELGLGMTLGDSRRPFLRTRARWQGLFPLTERASGQRLAARVEGGAVLAADDARIPATQRFLAGGDVSVRGYDVRGIGVPQPDGSVLPGRYLGVASLEWQRPLGSPGQPSDWEHTVFIDAGAVANRLPDLKPRYGVGTGVRYNSPVGPLQLDLAYGLETKRWRIHLSVGATF
jgi:translocation and assembly module TamA